MIGAKAKMSPSVVFILGPPGAGKGTQGQRIAETFGYYHISAGELLRQEQAKPGSKHGELIGEYLLKGKLVPADLICDLLKAEMNEAFKNEQKDRFLVDGFPRNMSNLEGWFSYGFSNDVLPLKFVLFLDCCLEESQNRCLNRSSNGDRRNDDNVDTLRKRFETYLNYTTPVLEYFAREGLLRRVDANRSQDEVFEDVKVLFR
ncbi:unnamed protein product [Acanthoscelides obtectus]|uniref:UMP/CMP kinase n=1 Tax=Acanthoscelides obtectus TaxID=200917 RepID=A0A9P0VNS7_ACAOB|nr:unnamed protein product [Acanthoscelides obtectus]CAK1676546.1 UMP-CMP kinase [Acanthoscelides obtectus]